MGDFLGVLGAFGVGGLLSSYLTLLWKHRQEDKRKHQDYKEQRYKCIIMLIHAHMNFEKNKDHLNKYGYDVSNQEDLKDLLEAELINSYLFASEVFIGEFRKFIDSPTNDNRLIVAESIRKDLWGLK